jgi:hypothetical protein
MADRRHRISSPGGPVAAALANAPRAYQFHQKLRGDQLEQQLSDRTEGCEI